MRVVIRLRKGKDEMKKLLAILQMIPALLQLVRTVEESFPIPKKGKEKMRLITGIIEDTYEEGKSLVPLVEKVVTRIVETANSTGTFQTTPKDPE
jgi:hypothetical protein